MGLKEKPNILKNLKRLCVHVLSCWNLTSQKPSLWCLMPMAMEGAVLMQERRPFAFEISELKVKNLLIPTYEK